MTIVNDTLVGLTVGRPQVYRNLTLFALEGTAEGTPDYVTLDAALAAGECKVTEVSESGSVPELRFENSGHRPVLLVDGEELVGAKQNRILNLSILAPAQQTIVIPVSCVEAGRWHRESDDFHSASRFHFAEGRSKKAKRVSDNLAVAESRASDQGEVWLDIEGKSVRFRVHSHTRAAAAMYEANAEALEAFVEAFPAGERQLGAVFAVDGYLVGVELFDHPTTFAHYRPKILRSYALDALDPRPRNERMGLATDDPEELLKRVAAAEVTRHNAIGLGEDLRLGGEEVTGGGLEHEGRLVHLAAFASIYREGNAADEEHPTRMVRASMRRRNRH